MKVVVFDDWYSVIHYVIGVVSYFIPLLAIIFFIYQIVEHFVNHELAEFTLGDCFEFCLGFAVFGLVYKLFIEVKILR
jgi:F0F1-type ATP synthase assembly protein I